VEQKKYAAANPSEPRQLNSWKDIAHYLRVNVRTAQKWERERGLPINRVFGPRSRVSADTLALDAWKNQITRISNQRDHCYRWPLAANVTVEVRFMGGNLMPEHVELLRDYLGLVKAALGAQD
jgi:hypothetical protein